MIQKCLIIPFSNITLFVSKLPRMFKTYIAKPKRNHGRQPLQQTNFQREKLSSVNEALLPLAKSKSYPHRN